MAMGDSGNEHLPVDFSSEEKQEARTFLRERFLRAVTGIVGKKCEVSMHENTKVTAEFGGSDVDVMHFYATQLATPMGIIPEALLRASDIISLHFPDIGRL